MNHRGVKYAAGNLNSAHSRRCLEGRRSRPDRAADRTRGTHLSEACCRAKGAHEDLRTDHHEIGPWGNALERHTYAVVNHIFPSHLYGSVYNV